MNKAIATQEKLLLEARHLLWARGYSNVSLREISQRAGVDVALISRYFGGKLGLFEATLAGAFDTPDVPDQETLVEIVVQLYVTAPRDGAAPSVLQLIQSNANDPDVGEMVRQAQAKGMQDKLEDVLGGSARAALFMTVLLGYAVAEKTLKLKGIPAPSAPEFEAQLRHLLQSALSYSGR